MGFNFKHKASIVYSAKVWLTALLLGPLVIYLFFGYSEATSDFLAFYAFCVLFGAVFSSGSFLLLFLCVEFVNFYAWRRWLQKLILALAAISLTVAPFKIVLQVNGALWLFKLGCSYALPVVIGIYFFRWPEVRRVEPDDEKLIDDGGNS